MAAKASKKVGAAQEALSRIKKLYQIEKDLRGKVLSSIVFLAKRKEQAAPVLQGCKQWPAKKSETVVPSTLLGKAVAYILKEWDKLVSYLEAPENLDPDRVNKAFLDHSAVPPRLRNSAVSEETGFRPLCD